MLHFWHTVEYLSFLLMLFSTVGILYVNLKRKSNTVVSSASVTTRFAILIPARYEAAVIEDTLVAIEKGGYPEELYDVYVIVESLEDPTVEIVMRHKNARTFLRRDLSKIGKGHALDECIRQIYRSEELYDAFFILDADNVIDENYLFRMNDAYCQGYDAGVGRRNNKYWNLSAVSSSSALTFLFMNHQNLARTNRGMHVTFTGTGMYIARRVLDEYRGFPFHTLTEDYEFSTYAMLKGLRTVYLDDSIYSDEQPRTLGKSIIQRSRWVRGYFAVRRKYRGLGKRRLSVTSHTTPDKRELMGAIPSFLFVFSLIFYLLVLTSLTVCTLFVEKDLFSFFLGRLSLVLVLIYTVLVLLTALLLYMNRDIVYMSRGMYFKTLLFHPVYLITYIPAAVRAIFIGNRWEIIEHTNRTKTDLS